MPQETPWTDERVRLLTRWWKRGMSANWIALQFGEEDDAEFTRNAILGKIHRLGLAKIERVRAGRIALPPKLPHRIALPPKLPHPKRRAPFRHLPTPIAEPVEPTPLGLPITELGPDQCRYAVTPDNTRDHLFCGAPGRPWCNWHKCIVYSPRADRPAPVGVIRPDERW
jgi:hypothetical protein